MSELSRRRFVKRVGLGAIAAGMPALLDNCGSEPGRGPASRAADAPLEKGGQDETGPYDVVEDWFKPVHEGFALYVDGVFAETPDRIFVASYGEVPIPLSGSPAPSRPGTSLILDHFVIILDASGRIVEEWTHAVDLMVHPHSVQISPYDRERHVWIIDREGHQIVKFTNDGTRVAMTLGEKGVAGDDEQHFNRPADIVFLADGSFLVADGYTGARVVKFDEGGRFLTAWGSKGTGPGQFDLVHCVAVDGEGRVYVADRNNGRVQIFDENGAYLDEWPIRRPNHLWITRDQFLWLADGAANRFAKFDLAGRLLTYWGTQGTWQGAFNNPHKFSVDSVGNLYVADYGNNRVQKFQPKANADPSP